MIAFGNVFHAEYAKILRGARKGFWVNFALFLCEFCDSLSAFVRKRVAALYFTQSTQSCYAESAKVLGSILNFFSASFAICLAAFARKEVSDVTIHAEYAILRISAF